MTQAGCSIRCLNDLRALPDRQLFPVMFFIRATTEIRQYRGNHGAGIIVECHFRALEGD
jgi:hypothetical protein